MTLVSDVIERTRRHLYSGETREERNKTSASLTADATSVGLTYEGPGIQRGAILAIDLEELYVWSASSTAATVSRGDNGTTAATHASGATILVNPKFSPFAILQAVNEELADLSSPVNGLFKVGTLDFTYSAGTDTYDLTGVTDLIDILDVTYDAGDGSNRWPRLRRGDWALARGMQTAEFASGMSLTINGWAESGRDINIIYKAPFTALSSVSQNVETISGLPASAHDILAIGAAIRLTAGTEVSRNFLDQADTRRADEVPPQARSSSMRSLIALRRERIDAEKARLLAKYPVVR